MSVSKNVEDKFKASMYKKLYQASKKPGLKFVVPFTGLGVGVISGVSTIVTRIALIIESVISGIAHIFGAPFFNNCKFKKGVAELVVKLPINLIGLPFSIYSAITGIFIKTFSIAFKTQTYTHKLWLSHDPQADAWLKRQQQEKLFKAEEKKLNDLLIQGQYGPQNVDIFLQIAEHYKTGSGVEKNEAEAFLWYKKAAKLKNAQAMHLMGVYYNEGRFVTKNDHKALKWFNRAAEVGNEHSKAELGLIYIMGSPVATQDYNKAVRFLSEAAQKKQPKAIFHLATLQAKGLGGLEKSSRLAVELYREAVNLNYRQAIPYLCYLIRKDPNLQLNTQEFSQLNKKFGEGFIAAFQEAQNEFGHFFHTK